MGAIGKLYKEQAYQIPDVDKHKVDRLARLFDNTEGMAIQGAAGTTGPIYVPGAPTGNPKYFRLAGETQDAYHWQGKGYFQYSDNGSTLVTQIDNAGYIFNAALSDIDYVIKGDTDAQLFNLDGGLDVIAMGGAVDASYKLKVHGATAIDGDLTFIGEQKIGNSAGDINIAPTANTTIGDGGTTNYANFAADGTLTLEGTARAWRCVDLEPDTVRNPGGEGNPEADDIDEFPMHRYDDEVVESVYYRWRIPHDFATGDGSVRGHFELVVETPPVAGGADVIVMGFEYCHLSDGDVFVFANTTSGTVNTTIAQDETPWITHDSATGIVTTTDFVAGDTILFRFYRDATNEVDTYTGAGPGLNDAWVFNYHLEYLIDKLGEQSA